jgi:hypothetical protein
MEEEMCIEYYDMNIRILKIERSKITQRGRLSFEEDIRLSEIDKEIHIYESLILKISHHL